MKMKNIKIKVIPHVLGLVHSLSWLSHTIIFFTTKPPFTPAGQIGHVKQVIQTVLKRNNQTR